MRPMRAISLRVHAIYRARPRLVITLAALVGAGAIAGLGWWKFRAGPAAVAPQADASHLGGPAATQEKPLIIPAATPAPRPTKAVTFADGCVTAECHAMRGATPWLHTPIARGECASCHAPDTGGHVYPLVREKGELCSSCHDTTWHTPVQHAAMTDEACLECHDPHAALTNDLLRAKTVRETCSACHPRSEGLVTHTPYADDRCELCHNSHGSDRRGLLRTATLEDNCRSCHVAAADRTQTSPHSHAKVEGSCLACHAPHTASHKGMLAAEARELCVSCHREIGETIAGATVSHDAVLKGERCARCHDPHGSDHPNMLRADQASTCLSCHDKEVKAADGRTVASMAGLADRVAAHDVAGHQECAGCHSVHGGSHARLLKGVAQEVPMGPYDARNFSLCFSCHDSLLASLPGATEFRDGERNLHAVHLNPSDGKSRGCASCHAVHAVGEPRLIAKVINFEGSGWNMPMDFTLREDGGSCGGACHEPLRYSRLPGGTGDKLKGGSK